MLHNNIKKSEIFLILNKNIDYIMIKMANLYSIIVFKRNEIFLHYFVYDTYLFMSFLSSRLGL